MSSPYDSTRWNHSQPVYNHSQLQLETEYDYSSDSLNPGQQQHQQQHQQYPNSYTFPAAGFPGDYSFNSQSIGRPTNYTSNSDSYPYPTNSSQSYHNATFDFQAPPQNPAPVVAPYLTASPAVQQPYQSPPSSSNKQPYLQTKPSKQSSSGATSSKSKRPRVADHQVDDGKDDEGEFDALDFKDKTKA